MKHHILFAGLGMLLAITNLMGIENALQNIEINHSAILHHPHHKIEGECGPQGSKGSRGATGPQGPTGAMGPMGTLAPGVLGVLSASSTAADSTNTNGLTFLLEFNTNFQNMSFSTANDLGFANQSSFTLSGPGEFLIETSGIITITAQATLGQGMGLSVQFLGTDDDWHPIFPGLSFNWIPPFAAPAGTSVGFNFSRSIQLVKGEVTVFRIAYFNGFGGNATITNKTLAVTQTEG